MSDCIIIGGGLIGMLTARNLHLKGYQVRLIEKSETGKESSWAGGGIISPLYPWRYKDSITQLASWGQKIYPTLAKSLFEDTGIDPEYTCNGLLILSPNEQADALAWSKRFSRSLSIVDPQEVANIEPAMAISQHSGIWLNDIAQIRNPRFAQALRADIDRRGIEVISHTTVTGFDHKAGKITGIFTDHGHFTAEQYAICTGAWTGQLLKTLQTNIAISPVQGQMILFKTQPNTISRIVLEEDRYIIPRRDGRVLFGSTIEQVDFNKQITQSAKKALQEIAVTRFPCLKESKIEHHWAGLRPGSPEGVPVIGQHPEFNNLFINAGHFRNGVVLAPASCQLMTDIIVGQKSHFDASQYALPPS